MRKCLGNPPEGSLSAGQFDRRNSLDDWRPRELDIFRSRLSEGWLASRRRSFYQLPQFVETDLVTNVKKEENRKRTGYSLGRQCSPLYGRSKPRTVSLEVFDEDSKAQHCLNDSREQRVRCERIQRPKLPQAEGRDLGLTMHPTKSFARQDAPRTP